MNLRETWHEKSSWWNQRNLFQRSYVKEPMRKNTFVKMGNYFKGSFLRELGLAKMSLDHKTQLSINQMISVNHQSCLFISCQVSSAVLSRKPDTLNTVVLNHRAAGQFRALDHWPLGPRDLDTKLNICIKY